MTFNRKGIKKQTVITSFKGEAQGRSQRQIDEEQRRIKQQKLIRELRNRGM